NTYQDIYEAVLGSVIANERLEALGVNVEDVLAAQEVQFDSEVNFLGKDGFQGYFFALAMLFSLYILILIYGQSVATSVAREKDNRTMELLITSTKPKALIIGKVLAVGLVGLLQLFTIIFGLVLGYLINKYTYPDVIHYFLKTSVQLDVILVYLVFSILGYLLYLFIFAALGSLVSKVEDVASSVTPITFLFVAAYMIATFGMNAPDSTLLKISSYVPFVSLFTTPIRYMMTNVSIFELLGSLLTMVVTTLIVMQLSIIIYRQGSLNYGNKMSLVKVIKSLIKKESIV
ncbi:MAG TPA: ABC transporter permease, partial [Erysipelothrix sp.]|nr:ABC transporter permease [Erysipelothrix sp.]